MIPKSLMGSNEFITKVIWSILRAQAKVQSIKGIHFKKINDEFFNATGFKMSDYFEFDDRQMQQFIKMKSQVFFFDEKTGFVRARDDFDPNSVSTSSQSQNLNRQRASVGGQRKMASGVGDVITID